MRWLKRFSIYEHEKDTLCCSRKSFRAMRNLTQILMATILLPLCDHVKIQSLPIIRFTDKRESIANYDSLKF